MNMRCMSWIIYSMERTRLWFGWSNGRLVETLILFFISIVLIWLPVWTITIFMIPNGWYVRGAVRFKSITWYFRFEFWISKWVDEFFWFSNRKMKFSTWNWNRLKMNCQSASSSSVYCTFIPWLYLNKLSMICLSIIPESFYLRTFNVYCSDFSCCSFTFQTVHRYIDDCKLILHCILKEGTEQRPNRYNFHKTKKVIHWPWLR